MNERYDYREHMSEDVKEWISENINRDDYQDRYELEEYLHDTLWDEDSVTGNASGSYYCSAWKAEEAICHNWDLIAEAMAEFDCQMSVKFSPEWADVTIRCYLLGEVISDVLDELEWFTE